MNRYRLQGCLLLTCMLVSTPAFAVQDVVKTMKAAGTFTTLVKALKTTGLDKTLSQKGQWTVFAPTDIAFSKLPTKLRKALLQSRKRLTAVLKYHVLKGRIANDDVTGFSSTKTFEGSPIRITTKNQSLYINKARVTQGNILCTNGVVHVINKVLLPPEKPKDIALTIRASKEHKTLARAIRTAGLTKALSRKGHLTVFAPTDEAFADLPASTLRAFFKSKKKLARLLRFHVTPRRIPKDDLGAFGRLPSLTGETLRIKKRKGSLFVAGVQLRESIKCTNGIIYIIDQVLTPKPQDIASVASRTPALKELVKALRAARLLKTISPKHNFTLFAPTNKAFSMLPDDSLRKLAKDKKKLALVLKYHLVKGSVMKGDLKGMQRLQTLSGRNLTLKVKQGAFYVGRAKVDMTPIKCDNGTIYLINRVLLPILL